LNGTTQGTRQGFELGFNNMVGVPTGQQGEVNADPGVKSEGFDDVIGH
jgi:hypothetical protein